MPNPNDPRSVPDDEIIEPIFDEGQDENTGQGDDGEEGVSPKPEVVSKEDFDKLREELEKTKESYKEAHRTITRQSQQLSEVLRADTRRPEPEQDIPADDYFSDPANATRKIVRSEVEPLLRQLEEKREQERQLERYLNDFSTERNIPVRRLESHLQRVQQSLKDPGLLLDTLAALDAAERAHEAVNEAGQVARDAVNRNARAVQTEAGATKASPPGKRIADMTADELEAYIRRKHGVVE